MTTGSGVVPKITNGADLMLVSIKIHFLAGAYIFGVINSTTKILMPSY